MGVGMWSAGGPDLICADVVDKIGRDGAILRRELPVRIVVACAIPRGDPSDLSKALDWVLEVRRPPRRLEVRVLREVARAVAVNLESLDLRDRRPINGRVVQLIHVPLAFAHTLIEILDHLPQYRHACAGRREV